MKYSARCDISAISRHTFRAIVLTISLRLSGGHSPYSSRFISAVARNSLQGSPRNARSCANTARQIRDESRDSGYISRTSALTSFGIMAKGGGGEGAESTRMARTYRYPPVVFITEPRSSFPHARGNVRESVASVCGRDPTFFFLSVCHPTNVDAAACAARWVQRARAVPTDPLV